MLKGVLADVNIEGQVNYLMALVRAAAWADLWDELGLTHATFDDLGLSREAPDSEIWQCCQEQGFVLITDNRNRSEPESLESTIRLRNAAARLCPTCGGKPD